VRAAETVEVIPCEAEDVRRRVIYCYTNKVDGKQYVGQAICRPLETSEEAIKRRWRGGYKTCLVFYRAIRKYGVRGFECDVLAVVAGLQAANTSEARWVARRKTIAPIGYNIDPGGNVAPRHPETGRKISEQLKVRFTAKQRSERARKAAAALVRSTTHEQRSAKASAALLKGWVTRRASPDWEAKAEQRREQARRARATQLRNSTHEQRSETARKCRANESPAQQEAFRKMLAGSVAMTPKQRSERSRRANAARSAKERSESAYKTWATRKASPGWARGAKKRSETARKIAMAKSAKWRAEWSRKGNEAQAKRRKSGRGRR
jgi:hypothetical protein